ncbi:cytochrome P450 [Leptolyngbya sp. FACHB-261]|uniref:cytochrome P450 n=1 Tax=Leptolyngbya sp. FACHB-261 TaxID=2692806 RepID=UPI0016879D15|nr:cytochrome P450 [Leptolyngbya sp. FACHB-261]MBD2099642.1 cytochrome P450 [Leptolyngbya sp. FACHB-261]
MTVQIKPRLKPADAMPGDYGLPFLGQTLSLFRDEELYYWQHFERYGPVFKTRVLGLNLAFLIGPDANRLVLMEQADHVSSNLGWGFLEPMFGRSLLLQDGEDHRASRRLMYPAFHGRAIASYFDTVQSLVQGFLQGWGARGTIPLTADFRKLTLIVASRLFLGSQTEVEVEQTSRWFTELMLGRLALLRLELPFTLHRRSQRAKRQLQAFLRQTIAQRQASGHLEVPRDVLGLLLAAVDEEGNRLSEAEILDQALLLLFAGHETTATLLSWTLFELGAHPEWRERLRAEQNRVVGNGPLELSHLKQLTELTNVLKEAERLYPPVYGIPRGVIKDIEYGGYLIPAGWYVDISPMLTHRLPELYADPDRFDPDRFAPPREEDKKHPGALVGFGSGPHGCLGFEFAQMEMKIVLSTLLRHYDWTVTPEYNTLRPVRQPSKIQTQLLAQVQPLNV